MSFCGSGDPGSFLDERPVLDYDGPKVACGKLVPFTPKRE